MTLFWINDLTPVIISTRQPSSLAEPSAIVT